MACYTIKFNNPNTNRISYIPVSSSRFTMPIQAPNWTEFLICPICTKEFGDKRLPISLGCSHTICKTCLGTLHRTQCPFDQTNITTDINTLPINNALLQLVSTPPKIDREINPHIIKNLTPDELAYYKTATQCIEDLALLLKPNGSVSGILSRPMQRKLVTLITCQLFDNEGRTRSLRAVRSLGERVVTELILQHQNPQQLSQNLWAAVRARGCQFLGPAMQEEVLKLVLLALEDGCDLSRKILVLYVVQKLKTTFPQASKTSIGHVVQLLYRASCFKVSKRESDSSLMTLKEEFRTYEALRREHDTQIVQIATEAGLRIAPDQWSALLYGDSTHKSHMQSIIDKQQNPLSFALSVNELVMALQRTGDPANLARLRAYMDQLALIDSSVDSNVVPTWDASCNSLKAVKSVVRGLIDFIQNHGNRKMPETSHLTHTSRYKVSFCREFKTRGHCARGNNCNFAHSEQELERYRTKYKKTTRPDVATNNNISNNNGNNPMRDLTNYAVSNGPNSKVNHMNMNNHHSSFSKGQDNGNNGAANPQQQQQRFNKPTPYRSENSLYNNSPMTPHHLKPTSVYSNASSTSTPNLSAQLSPNQQKINSNGPRFAFNGHGVNNNNNNAYPMNPDQAKNMNMLNSGKYMGFNHNRPPLSAPPMSQQYNNFPKSPDYSKKQLPTSYGNVPMNSPSSNQQKYHHNIPPPLGMNQYHNNNNNSNSSTSSSSYYSMMQPSTSSSPYYPYNSSRNSTGSSDEFSSPSWKHQKSPINLLPKTPTSHNHMSKPSNASSSSPSFRYNNNNNVENSQAADYKRNANSNRMPMQMNISPSAMMYQQQMQQAQNNSLNSSNDDVDGSSMWKYQQSSPSTKSSSSVYSFSTATPTVSSNMSKDKFIRSDSILTSNTDDSFDNLPNPNGRYGAIGIKKNTDTSEWSGLQTIASRYENNFEIGAADSFKPNIILNSVDTSLSTTGNSSSSGSGGDASSNTLNGNFLNMQIGNSNSQPATTANNSICLWSSESVTTQWADDDQPEEKHDDSFGSDQIAMSLWDMLNE